MTFSLKTLIFGAMGGTFAITGNMLALMIVGRINERVPENQKISYAFWNAGIRKRYKELYPQGRLVYLFDLCAVLMVACFPLLLWSMGFFGGQK